VHREDRLELKVVADVRLTVSVQRDGERTVDPLELLFDLVYVLAVGELVRHLAEHLDLRAGTETVVLALAIFFAWCTTAWGANWLEPDQLTVRVVLVGLMFASLLMSVAVADAFGELAWLFVTGYLLLQLGRSAFLVWALHGRPLGEHFVNVLIWEALAAVLWVAGAMVDDGTRLAVWSLAVVVSYGGAAIQHWLPYRGRPVDVEHSEFAPGHLIERFRLFFLIALGETLLASGNAFTAQSFASARLVALAIAFTGTVALWWCYFQRTESIGFDLAETRQGASAVGWWGTWTLSLIVVALIAVAAGNQLAIANPGHPVTLGFAIVAFGGPALFLLAQVIFLREARGFVPPSRVIGIAALAVLAPANAPFTRATMTAVATVVLVAVAVADTVQMSRPAPESHTGTGRADPGLSAPLRARAMPGTSPGARAASGRHRRR
jgi:low temperature requirement protein LtrA